MLPAPSGQAQTIPKGSATELKKKIHLPSQTELLRDDVDELRKQLAAVQRELQDLKARFGRHSHTYAAPGTYSGLPLDSIAQTGSPYRGRGMVILGGPGTPGNVGRIYRYEAQTSGPVQ